jgi:hypothetical protein
MNCLKCQEKIVEALAAGTPVLPPEVTMHQKACGACTQFYEAQQQLFGHINAGLRSLVNQPVPPSLLPRVRSSLQAKPATPGARASGFRLAAIPAIAVLAVAVASILRVPHANLPSRQGSSVAARQISAGPPAPQPARQSASVSRVDRTKQRGTSRALSSTPEVIVLAEERAAFTRFVSEVPEAGAGTLALAQPAQPENDEPTEIALLWIEPLDVKPIDSSSRK